MDRRGVARRITIPIAISILILLLFVCIPMVLANAHDETTAHTYRVATPNAQGTPTVDPTVTALQKEQLAEQVDRSPWNWIWNYGAAALTPLALLVGGLFALARWRRDRRDALKKQSEERFKSVVEGLGGDKSPDTKIASAVLLRTFLGPEYEQFYTQVFDLAVANLRPREHTDSSSTTKASVNSSESPESLSQALTTMFKESFPRARDWLKRRNALQLRFIDARESLSKLLSRRSEKFASIRIELAEEKRTLKFDPQLLDATDIQLDNAFLRKANLRAARLNEINLREAHLIDAKLEQVILSKANLNRADLTKARLDFANLTGANLRGAILTGAILNRANLTGADLREWIEEGGEPRPAILTEANLTGANLRGAILTGAILDGADLAGADFTEANLSETHLERAKSLVGTKLFDVIGLSTDQRVQHEAKGAIIE